MTPAITILCDRTVFKFFEARSPVKSTVLTVLGLCFVAVGPIFVNRRKWRGIAFLSRLSASNVAVEWSYDCACVQSEHMRHLSPRQLSHAEPFMQDTTDAVYLILYYLSFLAPFNP